jgi:hypothetical protein
MPPFMIPLLVALGAFGDLPQLQPRAPAPQATPVYAVPLGELAQRTVRVALRTSGFPQDAGEVDRIAARARWAGLMPELSIHGTQTQGGTTNYSSDTGTVSLSQYGPGTSLQASLTFHLDKLVYSGQEWRVERLRVERLEARAKITQRIIDEVARWSRALAEERDEPDGSQARLDAMIRRTSAQMALDVWTDGWFTAFLEGRAR